MVKSKRIGMWMVMVVLLALPVIALGDISGKIYRPVTYTGTHCSGIKITGPQTLVDHTDAGGFHFIAWALDGTYTFAAEENCYYEEHPITVTSGVNTPASFILAPGPVTDRDGDGHMCDVDCNDLDPNVYPGAPETSDDFYDSDCDNLDPNTETKCSIEGHAINTGKGSIFGLDLSDPSNTCSDPVPFADVKIEFANCESFTTQTDANGYFRVDDVPCRIWVPVTDTWSSLYPGYYISHTIVTINKTCLVGVGTIDMLDPGMVSLDVPMGYLTDDCDFDSDTYNKADDCNDCDPLIKPDVSEICDDSIDNNCDNVVDTDDPSCVYCAPTETDCSDSVDNDCDGDVDGDDSDCLVEDCSNGVDDDGDLLVDCFDTIDCNPAGNVSHPCFCDSSPEICDGKDNDCDQLADEGCDDDNDDYCDITMTYAGSIVCPNGGNDCDDENPDVFSGAFEIPDGVDNDCDGIIDCNDAKVVVLSLFENNCYDTIDNDCNGQVDCNDLGCAAKCERCSALGGTECAADEVCQAGAMQLTFGGRYCCLSPGVCVRGISDDSGDFMICHGSDSMACCLASGGSDLDLDGVCDPWDNCNPNIQCPDDFASCSNPPSDCDSDPLTPDEQCDVDNNGLGDVCQICSDLYSILDEDNNTFITTDVILCPNVYRVNDPDNDGVIILDAPGITLDCSMAQIIGGQIGKGIIAAKDQVTIVNCSVDNYARGIQLDSSYNTVYKNPLSAAEDLYISPASTGNQIYLNHFYASGITNKGTENAYCVGSEGNFYGMEVPYSRIG